MTSVFLAHREHPLTVSVLAPLLGSRWRLCLSVLLPLSFGCGVGSGFYHALLMLIRVSFTIRSEIGDKKNRRKKQQKMGWGQRRKGGGARGRNFFMGSVDGWVQPSVCLGLSHSTPGGCCINSNAH